jgi:hypothetical protein
LRSADGRRPPPAGPSRNRIAGQRQGGLPSPSASRIKSRVAPPVTKHGLGRSKGEDRTRTGRSTRADGICVIDSALPAALTTCHEYTGAAADDALGSASRRISTSPARRPTERGILVQGESLMLRLQLMRRRSEAAWIYLTTALPAPGLHSSY